MKGEYADRQGAWEWGLSSRARGQIDGLFLTHSRTRQGGDGQGSHMAGLRGGRDRTRQGGWAARIAHGRVAMGRDRTRQGGWAARNAHGGVERR